MKIKLFCALGCLCLLMGCGQQKRREIDVARENGILLVGVGPDPDGLDPQCVAGVTEQNILRALFEGLVKPDPKTLMPVPGAAASWSVNDEATVYLFSLRKNARWSNGDFVTAHDFVFSFQRLLTQSIGAPCVNSFFCIKNAQKFYHGEIDFTEVGVKALSDNLLEISLERPTPYFLSLLMQPSAYPLHQKTLQNYGGAFTRNPLWTQADHMVSNGPFRLKKWQTAKSIEVVKNEYYWNSSQVALSGIVFRPICDAATEERAFRSGQLHITEIVPYTKIKEYYKRDQSPLKIHSYLGTFYYIFNTQIYPLNDVRIRKALSLALCRDSLMGNDLFHLKHKSTFQLVPEGCNGFHCLSPLKEDVVEARKLLAEAGFPEGKNFPKLTLMFNTSEGQIYLASAIQEMWKKVLNINIELINIEWKVYLQRRREKNFEIARGGWIGEYNDPTTFLSLWHRDSPNNFTYWHNDAFDRYMQLAGEAREVQQRMYYLEQAEAIVLNELPLLPIHASATSHLVHKSVKNWFPNLLDLHPYDCITFSQD